MPIQYTQKSFTVLGENSPQAKKNFAEGYVQIDWSNQPKPGIQKADLKPERN